MGASLRKSGSSDLADNRACGWGASTAFAFSDCVCVGERALCDLLGAGEALHGTIRVFAMDGHSSAVAAAML